jgi:hypothetical protein
MRNLVRARAAKALAKEMFKAFAPAAVGLSRIADGFVIEVRFASEPPKEAREITAVRGFPVHIDIIGAIVTQKEE